MLARQQRHALSYACAHRIDIGVGIAISNVTRITKTAPPRLKHKPHACFTP